MSAAPPPYIRQANFLSWETSNPTAPKRGTDLDAEFDAIAESVDQTQVRLAEIQRDDGKLRNESVHPDALSPAVRALLAIGPGDILGDWASGVAYHTRDVVAYSDGNSYIATVDHVATSFPADEAAGKWLALTAGGGAPGGGETNTASNVGLGEGTLFKGKVGTDLQFKTLRAGTGVTITNGTNEVQIDATGVGGGETNTASNLGTGAGQVFAGKTGVDLRFRSIKAGTNMLVTQNGTEITLDVSIPAVGATWGSIGGALSSQTDLQSALNAKADSVHSHTFASITGKPTTLSGYGISDVGASSGSSLVGFIQAGTGAVARTMQDKARERVSLADYISSADLATAVSRSAEVEISTPFANAVAYLASIGGGELYIPAGSWKISSTVVIDEPSIDIVGAGGDGNHDVASPNTGTTIRWRGADGGEMIRVQSKGLVGSATPSGGSLRNLKLSGGAVNTMSIALLVASVRGWTFENITIYDPTSRGVYVTVQPLGAEARDTQKCLFRNITIRNLAAGSINAHGFELAGDAGANASFNIFEHCDVMFQNGAGYKLVTADNNMFTQCRAFRPSGTGYSLEVHGNNTAGFESNSNTFYGFSPSTGGVKLFGTTTYTVPSKNTVFYAFDMANGSAMPVVEVGATWHLHKSTGATYQDYLVKPVIGVDDGAVDAHRAARSNETLRIYNFSANHVRYVDGASNEWGVRIDGSGNFEVLRISGSGVFKVASATEFSGDLSLSSGNRLRLQGSGNLTGIRYSSPNVELTVGALFAAGFGINTVGFCGTTPIAKPTISGSKGGNAALASLLTALANMGLITDSTT